MRTDKDTVKLIKLIKKDWIKASQYIMVYNADMDYFKNKPVEVAAVWKQLIPITKNKTADVVSRNFDDAVLRSYKSFAKEMRLFEFKGSGVFIVNTPDNKNTMLHFYDVDFSPLRERQRVNFLVIQGGAIHSYKCGDLSFFSKALSVVKRASGEIDVPNDKDKGVEMSMTYVVAFLMFKKYAKIETKLLKRLESAKDFNTIYRNNIGINLNYLTINWWTDIIQSEGFNVRGHFRLQPYGERLTKKKIIWINEFHKDGYTLKARKRQCQ